MNSEFLYIQCKDTAKTQYCRLGFDEQICSEHAKTQCTCYMACGYAYTNI